MNEPPIPTHTSGLMEFHRRLVRLSKSMAKDHPKRAGIRYAAKKLRELMEDEFVANATDELPRCAMWCKQKIKGLWQFSVDKMHLSALMFYGEMNQQGYKSLKVNQAGEEITLPDGTTTKPNVKDFRRRSERLCYVGLLKKIDDCTWELTDLGWDFLDGKASIPKFYWMRDGECYGTADETITRSDIGPTVWNRAFWDANAHLLVKRLP
jgi:hypothetical protein